MANHNRVQLIGNLTRDPELKFLPSGTPVANFGLATNERFTDKESGEVREKACFVDCEAWQRTAEIVEEYLSKGSPVFIEGKLQFDQWENEEGQKRNKLKVRVLSMQMLGRSGEGNANGNGNSNSKDNSNGSNSRTSQTQTTASTSTEEEIPF